MLVRTGFVLCTVAALAAGVARGQVVVGKVILQAEYLSTATGVTPVFDSKQMTVTTTANTMLSLMPGTLSGMNATCTPSAMASVSFTAVDSTHFTGVIITTNNTTQATAFTTAAGGDSVGSGSATGAVSISFTPETPQYYRVALNGNVGASVMTSTPNGDPPTSVANNYVTALGHVEYNDFASVFGNQTQATNRVSRVYGASGTGGDTLSVQASTSTRASVNSLGSANATCTSNGQGEARFTTQTAQFVILPQDLQDVQHTFLSGNWHLPMTTASQPLQPIIATGTSTGIIIPDGSTVAGSLAVGGGAEAILGANGIIAPGAAGNIMVNGGGSIVAAGAGGSGIVAAGAGGSGIIAPGAAGGLTNTPNNIGAAGAGGSGIVAAGAGIIAAGAGGKVGGNMTLGSQGYALNVRSGGSFKPGMSPGRIDVFGSVFLENTSVLEMELGGTGQGTTYDLLRVMGTTADPTRTGYLQLDGILNVLLLNDFQNDPTLPAQVFTIATADQLLFGAFDNVASGSRLSTADGFGSFLVTYTGNSVVLSNFVPVPEPSSLALCAAAVGALAYRRRWRRG